MSKKTLVEFGLPEDAEWQQRSIADVIGDLESLIEREVERMEKTGAKEYGNGRLARRLEFVEQARIALEQSENV